MAANPIWRCRNNPVLRWMDCFRGSTCLSRQRHQEILRRSRAPPLSVSEGEPSICRSSFAWLRNPSSPKTLGAHSSTSLFIFSSRQFSLLSFNKNIPKMYFYPTSSSGCRYFHVKTSETPDKTSHSQQRSKQYKENGEEHTNLGNFTWFAIYGSAAALFTFGVFGLAGIWEANGKAKKFDQLLKSEDIKQLPLMVYNIAFVNMLVFLLWRLPALQPTMVKWFTLSIAGPMKLLPKVSSMFLCMFSHKHFFHIFANLYVLNSFSHAWDGYSHVFQRAFPENFMAVEKFVAFYLSAGMVASAGSLITKHFGKILISSLGASGAILGLIGYICMKLPDSRLSIIFLPQWSFTAKSGVKAIALFDSAGLLFGILSRWRYGIFDHAAHLSGLLFGVWYAQYGERYLYGWSNYVKELYEEKGRR
ncbi:unnamed protein product [Clavelina lepadiformis]|uniref:rhomboid protease n=1 Tax=Clavelina lepadiformis TaxID=159417 RepID=A0ABP0GI59_CLALP